MSTKNFLDKRGLSDLWVKIKQKIPTRVSQLENDQKYLTSYTESDPTVPSWAKTPNKPSYTASEVGAATAEQVQQAQTTATNALNAVNSLKTENWTFTLESGETVTKAVYVK